MYIDQCDNPSDIGKATAAKHGIPVFDSIKAAITLGGKGMVDGIIILAECVAVVICHCYSR